MKSGNVMIAIEGVMPYASIIPIKTTNAIAKSTKLDRTVESGTINRGK